MYYIYNNGLGKVSLNVRSVYSVTLLIIGLCTPKWNIRMQNIARGTEEPFFLGGWGGGEGGTNKKNSWQYHNRFLNTEQTNRIIMMIITTMLIE